VTEMRCTDVEARFIDAMDGRLAAAESVRFHAHIEGCVACRERAALWRGLVPELRGAVAPAPDAMTTRRMQVEIERKLAGAVAASPARRGRLLWGPAVGLAAAAAGVGIWLRASGHAPEMIGYAAITSVSGGARVGDRAPDQLLRRLSRAPLALAAGAALAQVVSRVDLQACGLYERSVQAREDDARSASGKRTIVQDERLVTETTRVAWRVGAKFGCQVILQGVRPGVVVDFRAILRFPSGQISGSQAYPIGEPGYVGYALREGDPAGEWALEIWVEQRKLAEKRFFIEGGRPPG